MKNCHNNLFIDFQNPSNQENLSENNLGIKIYWDDQKNLHVYTDRLGSTHLYYAAKSERSILGSSYFQIANQMSENELDWQAIAEFFTFGFFFDNKTYFKDIQILKPARHYIFSLQGKILSQERYWNWNYQPKNDRSYSKTIDEFIDLFHQVIKDQTADGKIAIPISGGLDSRSTVAAIKNLYSEKERKEKFWAYSYGYSEDSVEIKIAKEIAQKASLDFQSFTIKPYLFDELDTILSCVEGFQDITQCRQASIVDHLRKNVDAVLCAHWGDVWMDTINCKVSAANQRQQIDFILEKFKKRGHSWLLENLCLPHLENIDFNALLKKRIDEELKSYEFIDDLEFRMKAFKTDLWSFRWTLTSIRMFQEGASPRLPFYDDRLVDFFMTVPANHLTGRKLQIDYLKKMAPELAKVKWQPYDANLYHYQHYSTWLLPKRFFKKIRKLVGQEKTLSRNWEIQFLSQNGKENLKNYLRNKDLKIYDYIDKSVIESRLENFWAEPDASKGYEVSMLLTFTSWLEKISKERTVRT